MPVCAAAAMLACTLRGEGVRRLHPVPVSFLLLPHTCTRGCREEEDVAGRQSMFPLLLPAHGMDNWHGLYGDARYSQATICLFNEWKTTFNKLNLLSFFWKTLSFLALLPIQYVATNNFDIGSFKSLWTSKDKVTYITLKTKIHAQLWIFSLLLWVYIRPLTLLAYSCYGLVSRIDSLRKHYVQWWFKLWLARFRLGGFNFHLYNSDLLYNDDILSNK